MRYLLLLLLGLSPTMGAFAQTPDYLCASRPSLKMLQFYHWSPHEFPLRVYLPAPPAELKVEQPAMYIPVVQSAFAAWGSVFPTIKVVYVNTPAQAHLAISWRNTFAEGEGTWGSAYLPQPVQITNGHIHHRSVIHLAVRAQPGTGFAIQPILFARDELTAIATHEVGHALGLPHSNGPDDMMYPVMQRVFANHQWKITSRDVQTLKRIYSLPANLKQVPCP